MNDFKSGLRLRKYEKKLIRQSGCVIIWPSSPPATCAGVQKPVDGVALTHGAGLRAASCHGRPFLFTTDGTAGPDGVPGNAVQAAPRHRAARQATPGYLFYDAVISPVQPAVTQSVANRNHIHRRFSGSPRLGPCRPASLPQAAFMQE